MLISTESYNRYLLSPTEKEFFKRLVPLSYIINEWTWTKAHFLGLPSKYGVLPSIILADLLLMSENGNHPISKEDYNNKYSNNLALLESGSNWQSKSNVYENKSYRAYKNWRYAAEDYSDYLTFTRQFDYLLIANNFIDQAAQIALGKNATSCYSKRIITLINQLGLSELDGKIRKT